MTTSNNNRVFSYFFLFDFYHVKGTTDEHDLFPESIIYFYPPKEDIRKQVYNNRFAKKKKTSSIKCCLILLKKYFPRFIFNIN